jgi:hypothetical protein
MSQLQKFNDKLQLEFKKISSFRSAIAFLRGPFTEAIQEACALLPVNAELLEFFARILFAAVAEAMRMFDDFLAQNDRAEVIAAWHSVYLADVALKPYAAAFIYLFEGKFVDRLLAEENVNNLVALCPPSEQLTSKIKL